jgi:hypothetical protein
VVRKSGKKTGRKGRVSEVMLQRYDTESIRGAGRMVGRRGWREEEGYMLNRQNHRLGKNHTRVRAQPTKLHEKSSFRAVVTGDVGRGPV